MFAIGLYPTPSVLPEEHVSYDHIKYEIEMAEAPAVGETIKISTINRTHLFRVLDRQFQVSFDLNMVQHDELPRVLLQVEKIY